ncbi:MAG: AlpA family transcriptional regulator [Burkholderiales bacterium]|nr:AlpA family transcriptional regulator [Burkholderiales bacterium]
MQPPRLIRLREVVARTGRSRSMIYSDPQFPRPIKIGPRASAWLESEVSEWVAARIAAARSPAGGDHG